MTSIRLPIGCRVMGADGTNLRANVDDGKVTLCAGAATHTCAGSPGGGGGGGPPPPPRMQGAKARHIVCAYTSTTKRRKRLLLLMIDRSGDAGQQAPLSSSSLAPRLQALLKTRLTWQAEHP